jgi:hypothetical protein
MECVYSAVRTESLYKTDTLLLYRVKCRVPPATTALVPLLKTIERISIKFNTSGTYTKVDFIQWRVNTGRSSHVSLTEGTVVSEYDTSLEKGTKYRIRNVYEL